MKPIVLLNADQAINRNLKTYTFHSNKHITHWPIERGQGLGVCGMWNFLWRLGYHPKAVTIEQLTHPLNENLLFIDKLHEMDDIMVEKLKKWMDHGGKIFATGELVSWKSFFPSEYRCKTSFFENPHAALSYILADYPPQLIAPPNWNFIQLETSLDKPFFIGKIAAVQGERQTPDRAVISCCQNAPAIIHHHSFYYFNGHPFSAFQAWLQGQEDLSPWFSWRHRLFWLDEWVSFFCDVMIKLNMMKGKNKPGIPTLPKTSVILRHDLDYSKDPSFLFEENNRKIGATHAVLKDKNTNFWLSKLKLFSNHETAFHYNTGKRNWNVLYHRIFTKKNRVSYRPNYRQITGLGLLKQLKWANQRGIDIKTIHRHLCFLIYPEWIDAMDHVFESDLNVLGSSSLFRSHVLKWGTDQVDGQNGFLAYWPDAQFPLWYPFKLGHAGKNGKMLKGWEMTALMEIEPEMLTHLLDYNVKHITQNIFTLIFHPAHANQSSLYRNGSLPYFKKILNILTEREINILPMKAILQHANNSFGA